MLWLLTSPGRRLRADVGPAPSAPAVVRPAGPPRQKADFMSVRADQFNVARVSGRAGDSRERLQCVPPVRSCHSSPGGLIMSAPQVVHRLTNRPRSHRLATRSAVCLPNSECRLTMRRSRKDLSAFLVRLLPPPTPTLRSRAALLRRHSDAGSAARGSSNLTRSLRGAACHLLCPLDML
jgi:hypothetical protein